MADGTIVNIGIHKLILDAVPARLERPTSKHNRASLLLHRSMSIQQPSNDIPINRF